MSKITQVDKKTCKKFIKETVVVEGKSDTQKLQKIFHVKTIETNGSALTVKTINLIKAANAKNGVILFLDPDYQGKKIRNKIAQFLENFKECYISKNDMQKSSTKIGIAEANDLAIINAFKKYISKTKSTQQTIDWIDYLKFNLNTKEKRLVVSNYLGIDYFNHKQLFNQLNLMGITKKDLERIINEQLQKK